LAQTRNSYSIFANLVSSGVEKLISLRLNRLQFFELVYRGNYRLFLSLIDFYSEL